MNASVIGRGGACRSVACSNADLKNCSMSPAGTKGKIILAGVYDRFKKAWGVPLEICTKSPAFASCTWSPSLISSCPSTT